MPINNDTLNNTPNDTSLDRLRDFLNKLFQFETQDLDFGIYKILNYKRKDIKKFIDDLLVTTVKDQLITLTDKQVQEAHTEMEELAREAVVSGWVRADAGERQVLEKYGWDRIKLYREYADIVETAQAASDTENQIYNHLALFFSRYYDKGDFISKRVMPIRC